MQRKKHKKIKRPKRTTGLRIIFLVCPVAVFIAFGFYFHSIIMGSEALDKSSTWYSFLGAYLAFAGTFAVSAISLFQSHYYKRIENDKYLKEIQPVISVEIVARNVHSEDFCIQYPDKTFAMDDQEINDPEANQNVYVKIRNASENVTRNIMIFDSLFYPVLEPHQDLKIVFSYDLIDESERDSLIESNVRMMQMDSGLEDDTSDGFTPDNIWLTYEDTQGNRIRLDFELLEFENGRYYSQEGLEIEQRRK